MGKRSLARSAEHIVHRCRFLEPRRLPQVVAVAVEDRYVAVARACGDLEVFDLQQNWALLVRVPATQRYTEEEPSPIRALHWVSTDTFPRLLSVGLDGLLTEWDLQRCRPKHTESSYGGAVWSADVKGSSLACACDDGTVRFFDVSTDIAYQKQLLAHDGRALSVAFSPNGSQIATTGVDGKIKVWNCDTLQQTVFMEVESTEANPVYTWVVRWLHDTALAGGDSNGHIQTWNAQLGTQEQLLEHHETDVTSLVVAGNHLFAAGADNLVSHYERTDTDIYAVVALNRAHSHDVLTLAYASSLGCVISGGMNGKLILHEIQDPGRIVRSIPALPSKEHIAFAAEGRILADAAAHDVFVWKLGQAGEITADTVVKTEQDAVLLARLQLPFQDAISCVSISPKGDLIAISSATSARLIQMNPASSLVNPVRHALSDTLAPFHCCALTEDGTTLMTAGFDRILRVYSTSTGDLMDQAEWASDAPLSHVQQIVTWDSTIAVTDGVQPIVLYSVSKGKLKRTDALPQFETTVTSMTKHPCKPMLIAVCSSNQFHLYDIKQKRLVDRSKEYGQSLPQEMLDSNVKVHRILVSPHNPSLLLLQSNQYICFVDLDLPVPKSMLMRNQKRRKSGVLAAMKETYEKPTNFILVTRYRPIVFAATMSTGALVLAERPWSDTAALLPNPIYRHKYGT